MFILLQTVTQVMISQWYMDIAPTNVFQCGVSLFWPTSQTFSAKASEVPLGLSQPICVVAVTVLLDVQSRKL